MELFGLCPYACGVLAASWIQRLAIGSGVNHGWQTLQIPGVFGNLQYSLAHRHDR